MKRNLRFVLILAATICMAYVYAVKVDTAYIYTEAHNSDSVNLFLVVAATIGSTPCGIYSSAISNVDDTIVLDICYSGGTALILCSRTDTFEIGFREKGETNILAAFTEYYNNQCRSSSFYQDTFRFYVNTADTVTYTAVVSQIVLSLHPNPANTQLTLTIPPPTQPTTATITNINGQVLRKEQLLNATNTLNIAELPVGLYFITVQNEEQRVVRRFVKQ